MSDHDGHDLIRQGAPSVLFLSLLFGQELPVFLSVDHLSFFVLPFPPLFSLPSFSHSPVLVQHED